MEQNEPNEKLKFLQAILLSLDPLVRSSYSLTISIVTEIVNSVQDRELLVDLAVQLIDTFLKENVTGQSNAFQDSDIKIARQRKYCEQILFSVQPNSDQQILWASYAKEMGLEWFTNLIPTTKLTAFNDKYLITANCRNVTSRGITYKIQRELLESLSLGGESFNQLVKYKQLFVFAQLILVQLQKLKERPSRVDLWIARLYMLQNELLYLPVHQCQEIIIPSYHTYLQTVEKEGIDPIALSLLYIEYSGMLLFYYKYKKSSLYLQMAEQLQGVRFELTGRLGVRTKYQEEKTAQLCAQAVVAMNTEEDLKELQRELDELPTVESVLKQSLGPSNIELSEDTILYEVPKVDMDTAIEKNVKTNNLAVHEHILLLGVIEHLHKANAKDETMKEQTEAYLNLMLDKSNNWLVFSKGLLLRSLNEFGKFKRMERSLTQLQVLVDQFNDVSPAHSERATYYYSIHYPDLYSLSRVLGQLWMKLGGLQSGYEIFSKLEMWDDCIECLVGQGELQKAAGEIEKFIAKGTASLKMKCMLGEIRADVEMLEQVWVDSNMRFARAKRSLGEYYFFRAKDYPKAAAAYEEAVKVNSYHANSWFVMGCSYMRIEKLEQAIQSFGQCVSIDESNGEAWANLSSCLATRGEMSQAMAMLEQAVKYHEHDFRMWNNLLNLALRNKKFQRFYICIEKLVQLNQRSLIDETILKKINMSLKYGLAHFDPTQKRQVRYNRDRVDRLYTFLTKEIGQNYEVWDNYADVVEIFILTEEMLIEDDLKQLAQESELTTNTTSKVKFQSEELNQSDKIQQTTEERIHSYHHRIADYRLKSCQMAFKVGWEVEQQFMSKYPKYRKWCQIVYQQLQKLIPAYKSIKTGDDLKSLALLIQQVVPKIESTLELKVVLPEY